MPAILDKILIDISRIGYLLTNMPKKITHTRDFYQDTS
jgi:hypothetical protein